MSESTKETVPHQRYVTALTHLGVFLTAHPSITANVIAQEYKGYFGDESLTLEFTVDSDADALQVIRAFDIDANTVEFIASTYNESAGLPPALGFDRVLIALRNHPKPAPASRKLTPTVDADDALIREREEAYL